MSCYLCGGDGTKAGCYACGRQDRECMVKQDRAIVPNRVADLERENSRFKDDKKTLWAHINTLNEEVARLAIENARLEELLATYLKADAVKHDPVPEEAWEPHAENKNCLVLSAISRAAYRAANRKLNEIL